MESLLAFIPEDRRIALAEGQTLPNRTTGSVLFADISGFTPLTAALAQELGVQRGAEEVLNQINPVYEAIIAELHHYGGSVMGFAGDSITCWLDGDNGHRAVACALAMQAAMRPFATIKTPGGTPISLAIKVAVACGPARRFIVGDPEIQLIDVLAGRTLDHVASAEKVAEKGDVVVGHEVINSLGDLVEVAEWRTSEGEERFAVVSGLRRLPEPSPHPPIAPNGLDESQTRPWALQPVYHRLRAGARFLAELRPTVALFLKFTGIDYDNDDEAGAKLDAFVRLLQATVEKQEGFLIQLTIGDKGSYAYASFGAPVAHDDDAVRSVAAALELREIPEQLDYIEDIQIGISRGRIWAGECGARSRHTYGVMGNEVNMAARLMSKAHAGQVLVRRRVAEEAKREFQFNQLGLITVKGGAEPIPVAEVAGRQPEPVWQSSQFELPLVGRDAELVSLERMLDIVLAGRGQVVSIVGATGIGKSHLSAVFQERAINNGFQVVAGMCQRIFQTTTYFPWQQVLRQIFGLTAAPLPDQNVEEHVRAQIKTVERTVRQINSDWAVRIPLLGDILGLPIPENATTAAFDPRQRQETLFGFVIDLIRFWTSSQPLLIVFDNLHWMDAPSGALLAMLSKAAADLTLMIMVITRPTSETGAEHDAHESLKGLPHHQPLVLRELNKASIDLLVSDLLGGRSSLLANLLIEAKAQGSPFFTRELVDALRESGQLVLDQGEWGLSPGMVDSMRAANALVQEDGTWVLAEAADLSAVTLGIPDSVHGVILARLDRLPDTHKPTVKVASVIGYTFELGLLAQVLPTRPSKGMLREQAHTLEERDFIVHDRAAETDMAGETYTFRQQATQEVSYETLLFTQRRELHRNLAEILEQQAPDETDQIAYHAYLGEDWARSLRYQLRAAQHDKQLFANLQSIDHLRKALTSAEHLPAVETLSQRQMIHADLGDLLITLGLYDESMEHLTTALDLAQQANDTDATASTCRWIARSFELRGEYEPALSWIERGLGVLSDRVTPTALELRLIAGLIYSRRGEYKAAGEQALASLLAAQEIDEASIVARAHNLLGTIDRLRGRTADATQHFEEALTIYRTAGNLQGQALAQNSLATAYFDMGQWSEADQYYRQAAQIFSQIGNVYNRLLVDNNIGGIALNQGRLDDALFYYRRALRAMQQIGGSLWVVGALHLNLGATHIRRHELPTAFEHLQKSRELFERAQVRDLLPEMHRRQAEAYLAQGDLDQATREVEQSLAIADELSMLAEQGQSLRIMGEVAATEARFEASAEYYERAIELLTQVGDDYGLACAQLGKAQLCHLWARPEECHALLALCMPVLERLGAAMELQEARRLKG